jgi:antiviral helicase SKI2
MLRKRELLPVIIFTFSKKKCEEYANSLSNIDLSLGASEKSSVHLFIEKSLSCLSGSDKELPQIQRMRDLLSRGIAVHHGGLLPIVKEIVEILFTRGLVRVLFATETFAMGVNAPAKSVAFSSIRKHDGQSFRDLLPGEYTQMSGRAGRRGLDSTGVVLIICSSDIPDQAILSQMILGKPTRLQSQFRLTYSMILNLLRVQTLKVEEMIKRSFSENTGQKEMPDQKKWLEQKAGQLQEMQKVSCIICDSDIYDYYDASRKIMILNFDMKETIISNVIGLKALCPGRIVIINNSFYRNTVGMIVQAKSSELKTGARMVVSADKYYEILMLVDIEQSESAFVGNLQIDID